MKSLKNTKYVKVILFFLSGLFVPCVAYVLFLHSAQIPTAELKFVEHSKILGESSGAMFPASCNSTPPSNNHATTYVNDCPPVVETKISSVANAVTADITGLTATSFPVAYYAPYWYVGGGSTYPEGTVVTAQLNYTSTNATKCLLGVSLVWPSGSLIVSVPLDSITNWKIKCTDGVHWSTEDSINVAASYTIQVSGGGGCFVPGTKVTMVDGTQRNIELVRVGEYLKTSKGIGMVEKLFVIAYKGDIYEFNNDGSFFFTPSHPFKTLSGWKSLDPELSMKETDNLNVTKLEIGDILIMEDGSHKKINSLNKKYTERTVYNFKVGGSHDFYADGYLVHNGDHK